MLFSSLLALAAAVSTTVFGETLHRDHQSKACSRELEAIVFGPPNCAKDYMRKITQSLVPLLWTDRAKSVIQTFENQFGVVVKLYDAFGEYHNEETEPSRINNFNYNYERTVALGEAFASYPLSLGFGLTGAFYMYSTLLWNGNGQMYTAFVLMNKTNAPLAC